MTLLPLRDLEASSLPDLIDVRRWRVLARDGTPLGIVAEVIVDTRDAAPVYLQLVPQGHPDDAPPECWVRVPFRHARVDDDERRVVLNDMGVLGLGTGDASVAARHDVAR